jgi:hypothetical protein
MRNSSFQSFPQSACRAFAAHRGPRKKIYLRETDFPSLRNSGRRIRRDVKALTHTHGFGLLPTLRRKFDFRNKHN